MSKITTIQTLEDELLSFWLTGWPEYATDLTEDYQSIFKLVEKIASKLQVEPSEVSGHERVCSALTNIASYCRDAEPWGKKNIFYANMCFTRLYNEMSFVARQKRLSQMRSTESGYTLKNR